MGTEKRMLARRRAKLDEIDHEIIKLIRQRAEVVRMIQDTKAAEGVGTRDYDREVEILNRVTALNDTYYPNECIRQVFQALLFHAPATSRR